MKHSGTDKIKTAQPAIPRYLLLFGVAVFMTLTSCRKDLPDLPEAPSLELFDLSYGNKPIQRYNLFLPKWHDDSTMVILVIHGGGWVAGDKSYVDYYARRFSDLGFAAVSMNYRLAGASVHYPEMLDDIGSMLQVISQNSGVWGIGTGPVAIFGYSAGGHLALLYSYSRNTDGKIGSVISLAGPTDIQDRRLWETPGLYDEIVLMADDPDPAGWSIANPVQFVSPANPATLLIHGTNDSVVPFSQALILTQALKTIQNPVELYTLENETHYFTAGGTEKFLAETKRFLEYHMK